VICFVDGETEEWKFTVANAEEETTTAAKPAAPTSQNVPKTGDTNHTMLWIILLAVSLAVTAEGIRRMIRNR